MTEEVLMLVLLNSGDLRRSMFPEETSRFNCLILSRFSTKLVRRSSYD